MECEINGRSAAQFIGHICAKIQERGIWHCLRRLLQEILHTIIRNFVGILAYPFCIITNTRFVPFYVRSIGHLCVELDCYIKEEILGIKPKYNSIVLAPRGTVANDHLLNYWKQYNIKVIDSPLQCFFLDPLSRNRFSGYNVYKYAFSYNPPFPRIQKQYQGRPPLLTLTEFDCKRGWDLMEKIGISRGSWFACVHCREDSYLGDVDQVNRSCDIDSYFSAMEMVIARGGWVIRMGDSRMKKIPNMKHVIDYAHLEIKCDWMDIFLSASCRFFLGSNSGLCHVPTVFGVPGAIANCVPMSGTLSYGVENVSIPKLVWSNDKKRYLTFREVFDSPISNYRLDSSYSKSNVIPIENSPQDITDLAIEMLDRVEGKGQYADEDEILQNKFKSLMKPVHYSYGAISRVGKDFLRKYKYLLSDVDKEVVKQAEFDKEPITI